MNKSEIKWKKYLLALKEYAQLNGHTAVPADFGTQVDGSPLKLGNWVGYIRLRGRTGRLSPARRSDLERIPWWTWDARKPGPRGNPARDAEIAVARRGGRSLQSIAMEWNISRQRVHQIVKNQEVSA